MSSRAREARSMSGRMPIAEHDEIGSKPRCHRRAIPPSARSVPRISSVWLLVKKSMPRASRSRATARRRRRRAGAPSVSASDAPAQPTCRAASNPRLLRDRAGRRRSPPRGGKCSPQRSSPRHRRYRERRARREGRDLESAAPAASSRSPAAVCRRGWRSRRPSSHAAQRGRSPWRARRQSSTIPCCSYQSRGLSDDVVERLLAGEHRGQEDAVVVRDAARRR